MSVIIPIVKCVLFIVIRKNRNRFDYVPILSVIHTITIGTSFNGGNNGHRLNSVVSEQTLSVVITDTG